MADRDAEGRPSTYDVPSHAEAATEHVEFDREIQYKQLVGMGVGLLIVAVISGVLVFFLLRGFVQWRDEQSVPGPVMAPATETVPGPRLLARPERELSAVRRTEDERLGSYGWVDQAGGVAHIPIDRALEIAARNGVPGLTTAPAPAPVPPGAAGGPATPNAANPAAPAGGAPASGPVATSPQAPAEEPHR